MLLRSGAMAFGLGFLLMFAAAGTAQAMVSADTGLDLLQNCEGRHATLDGFNKVSPEIGQAIGTAACIK